MSNSGLRWIIKSAVGLGVNLLLLTVWVDYVGVPAEFAALINWGILSVYGYVVAWRWVFPDGVQPDGVRGHVRQYLGMQGILAGGKIVNYLVYIVVLQVIDYRLAWVLGAGVGLVVSFGGNASWWRERALT